ncbi:hypothetical protein EN841_34540, partial [Mesorhizobium sp. M8A.F.Ca.ET.198.01.1.1]
KKLQFPAWVEKPNHVVARALQQAVGGANPQHGGTFPCLRLYHRDFQAIATRGRCCAPLPGRLGPSCPCWRWRLPPAPRLKPSTSNQSLQHRRPRRRCW